MYQLRSVVTSMLAGYMTSVTEIFGKCLEIYLNIGNFLRLYFAPSAFGGAKTAPPRRAPQRRTDSEYAECAASLLPVSRNLHAT